MSLLHFNIDRYNEGFLQRQFGMNFVFTNFIWVQILNLQQNFFIHLKFRSLCILLQCTNTKLFSYSWKSFMNDSCACIDFMSKFWLPKKILNHLFSEIKYISLNSDNDLCYLKTFLFSPINTTMSFWLWYELILWVYL